MQERLPVSVSSRSRSSTVAASAPIRIPCPAVSETFADHGVVVDDRNSWLVGRQVTECGHPPMVSGHNGDLARGNPYRHSTAII